jgi:hypothetical protein
LNYGSKFLKIITPENRDILKQPDCKTMDSSQGLSTWSQGRSSTTPRISCAAAAPSAFSMGHGMVSLQLGKHGYGWLRPAMLDYTRVIHHKIQ